MNILKQASNDFGWDLNLGEICRIWTGGCIIRAVFLQRITKAYTKDKNLPSLLMDDEFGDEVTKRQESWRRVVTTAIMNGVPAPSMSSSLAYYDSYRSEKLSANLIQAQRDFFGAHTYRRIDMEGTFHSHWGEI
jgi:6-phosphogluconate dehydrogenase